MITKEQQVRFADAIIMIDNGKHKLRVIRPLKDQIPEELIKNVLLKIS